MERIEKGKDKVAYKTVNVTTSHHSSKTTHLLTLSKNDPDSVDILQLVFNPAYVHLLCTRDTCPPSTHTMLGVKRQQVGMQHHGSEHNEVIML